MLGKATTENSTGGQVIEPPVFLCTPNNLIIPNIDIPSIAGLYTYSYRINNGPIITNQENAGGNNSIPVLVNILGYYGFFKDLVTHATSALGSPTPQGAFFVSYDSPIIEVGSVTDSDVVKVVQNTIEFLITENTKNDLIKTIFGESVLLNSCAIVKWK